MLILITTAIISVYRNIVNAEHIGFVMNGVASFSVQGAQQLRKQKRSTVFLCFPFVECTLRRISYRPQRGKLPSVCWQLPGIFRTPRSIYAVASYTATRVIYGTTGLAFSLRDHILPPGRPLCGSLIILKSGVMACEAMLLSASSVSR